MYCSPSALVRHGRSAAAGGAALELPDLLAGLRVGRDEVAVGHRLEEETAGGGERARRTRAAEVLLPRDFSRASVDRGHDAMAGRHPRHAPAAENEHVRILRAAEPLQRRVAERVEVPGLRTVGHRRDAHAPGRRQQVRHLERRRCEEAPELETRRDLLFAPFIAVRQHAIRADRIGLRRNGVRARILRNLRSSIC